MKWISDYLSSSSVNLGKDERKQRKYVELLAEIDRCNLCDLKNRVCLPGTGTLDADIVFVGEAPSKNRTYHLTFGERSRRVFELILAEMGFTREEVWATNVVKCISPGVRVGEPELCRRFLSKELAIIKPRFVVALGSTASRALLGRKGRPGDVVKREFTVFCMPHPMAAVYDPSKLRTLVSLAAKAKVVYLLIRGGRRWTSSLT